MLYDRDYNVLTSEEKEKWNKAESLVERKSGLEILSGEKLKAYYEILPLAVYHHKSVFPNNYINIFEIKKEPDFLVTVNKLKDLIDNPTTVERSILNFFKNEKAYFIIASILKGSYNFGHHNGVYVFPEFPLSTNYVVDFLIIGKNSGGHEFIFVELEASNNNITTEDGSWGATVRKGIKQIEDWDTWLDANFTHLRPEFEKHLGRIQQLPKEFYILDKTRIHFAVVAGRRKDYKEKTYRLCRKSKSNNLLILHYDKLIELAEALLIDKSFV